MTQNKLDGITFCSNLLKWSLRWCWLYLLEPDASWFILHIKFKRQKDSLLGRETYVRATWDVCSNSDTQVSESRPVQSISVRYIPVQTVYSPDGRILIVFSSAKVMYCLRFGKQNEDSKPQWYQAETLEGVRNIITPRCLILNISFIALNFFRHIQPRRRCPGCCHELGVQHQVN